MDINEIDRLMQHFEQSSLSELELTLGGDSLRMRKPEAGIKAAGTPALASAALEVPERTQQTADGKTEASAEEADRLLAGCKVTAPLVGTFYRAPQPGAEPYVEVGKQVRKGDTIGMIEAMKIMNEIPAPADGVVVSIEADDAQFVEFGQVLVIIKES